jgi:predicted dithiol-disulfide oxidoreductase (DUF899 family)
MHHRRMKEDQCRGCSKLMDKSSGGVAAIGREQLCVRYTARTEQVMSKRSWKEKTVGTFDGHCRKV